MPADVTQEPLMYRHCGKEWVDRERYIQHMEKIHRWPAATLQRYLDTCTAALEREARPLHRMTAAAVQDLLAALRQQGSL